MCDSSGLMRDLVLRPLWKIESLKVTVFFFKKKKSGGGGVVGEKKTPPFPGRTGCPPTMIYLFISSRGRKTKRKRKKKLNSNRFMARRQCIGGGRERLFGGPASQFTYYLINYCTCTNTYIHTYNGHKR